MTPDHPTYQICSDCELADMAARQRHTASSGVRYAKGQDSLCDEHRDKRSEAARLFVLIEAARPLVENFKPYSERICHVGLEGGIDRCADCQRHLRLQRAIAAYDNDK